MKVIEKLLSLENIGIEDFCVSIADVFSKVSGKKQSCILYVKLIDDNSYQLLDKFPKELAGEEELSERNINNHPICRKITSQNIQFVICSDYVNDCEMYIERVLSLIMDNAISLIKRDMRRQIINETIISRDINSFLNRVCNNLTIPFFDPEEFSAFKLEEKRNIVSLSGSNQMISEIPKSDIFYGTDENSALIKCLNSNKKQFYSGKIRSETEVFDEYMFKRYSYNRVVNPVTLPTQMVENLPSGYHSALGVLRFTNFSGKYVDTQNFRITQYEDFISSFISEIVFVLTQKFLQFQDYEQRVSRITHGVGGSIDTAAKYYDLAKEVLLPDFDNVETSNQIPNFSIRVLPQFTSNDDFINDFLDLGTFIDDLQFQFRNAVMQTDLMGAHKIHSLHSEVLVPLLKIAPQVANFHAASPPNINNFKEAKSTILPNILGNTDGLISVFRNLIDNSVKYRNGDDTNIRISFSTDEKRVYVHFRDTGIGIPSDELESIFVDGHRAKNARIGRKIHGLGIGLSYAREVMRAMDGEIQCLQSKEGCHFKIGLMRSK